MPGAVNVAIRWTRPGAGSAPVITSPAFLVAGTVDTLYPTTYFTATGTAPITWSITAGTLPAGMTFSSGGVLAGTPTATSSGSITFRATNAYGFDQRTLTLTVGAAGAAPVLVTAPSIGISPLGPIRTTTTVGAILSVSPGTYFQDVPNEPLSVLSVTRTTVAGYSRAWTVQLNTAFTSTLRNGFVFGVVTREVYCGIYSVSGDKKTLTLVSDNWLPSTNPDGRWSKASSNIRVTTTTGAATTTTVTINPGYRPLVQVGDTVEIAGYSLTYVTGWDGDARIATVSPALSSAPTVGTAVTVVGEPKTTDGAITAPPVQKSWAWFRDGVAIAGANSRSYSTTNDDNGKTITAREYATYWDDDTSITTTVSSNSVASSGSVDSTLIYKKNFSYLGAFRVPVAAGANPLNWSGTDNASAARAVFYRADGNGGLGSLILSGRNADTPSAYLTEISIPTTLDTTGVVASMTRASFLTPSPYFFDVTSGQMADITSPPGDPNGIASQAAFIYNGNIYQNYKSSYQSTAVNTYFKRSGTSLNAGTTSGPYRFAYGTLDGNTLSANWFGGPACAIPSAYQASLGGPMLQGNWQMSNPEPEGYGPFLSVFDPDSLNSTNSPNQVVLGYSTAHPMTTTATFAYSDWQRSISYISGMAFPSGSKSVLMAGVYGAGRRQYGNPFFIDESNNGLIYPGANKGWHSYPRYYAVYAFNADDLVAVKAGTKNPYDVTPYALWSIEFPGQDSYLFNGANCSMCFDDANKRMFFFERESPRAAAVAEPIIHVFQMSI